MEKNSISNQVCLILMGICFSFCVCGQIFMNINNSQYNVTYDLYSNCNLIDSSNVSNDIKCLMLCQMTICKSVKFDASTNNCTLFGSNPSLIKYDSVVGLNLTYKLDTYLNIGQPCLFNFTCDNRTSNPYCSNGLCNCIRDISKYNMGLINEWTLNNTLNDSVQCNDLILYQNATFSLVSTNPLLYSAYVPNSGYLKAPKDVYFWSDFTVTAYVLVNSIRNWSRVIDFANSGPTDGIQLDLSRINTGYPVFAIANGSQLINTNSATKNISLNVWTHIAGVLNGTLASIYLNGTLCKQTTQFVPKSIIRTKNYIGRSNYASDELADAKFRNVRIYNKALTLAGLINDMNN